MDISQFATYGIPGIVMYSILFGYGRFLQNTKRKTGNFQLAGYALFVAAVIGALIITTIAKTPDSKSASEIVSASKAESVIKRLQRSVDAKDVDGIIELFSSDVVIVLSRAGNNRKFSRSEYREYVGTAFKFTSSYQLVSMDSGIFEINGGHQALVTALVGESTNILGQYPIKNFSQQTFLIEMRDGLPKITSVMVKALDPKLKQ